MDIAHQLDHIANLLIWLNLGVWLLVVFAILDSRV